MYRVAFKLDPHKKGLLTKNVEKWRDILTQRVRDAMKAAVSELKSHSPVKSGALRGGWRAPGQVSIKNRGNGWEIQGKIINNVYYSSFHNETETGGNKILRVPTMHGKKAYAIPLNPRAAKQSAADFMAEGKGIFFVAKGGRGYIYEKARGGLDYHEMGNYIFKANRKGSKKALSKSERDEFMAGYNPNADYSFASTRSKRRGTLMYSLRFFIPFKATHYVDKAMASPRIREAFSGLISEYMTSSSFDKNVTAQYIASSLDEFIG